MINIGGAVGRKESILKEQEVLEKCLKGYQLLVLTIPPTFLFHKVKSERFVVFLRYFGPKKTFSTFAIDRHLFATISTTMYTLREWMFSQSSSFPTLSNGTPADRRDYVTRTDVNAVRIAGLRSVLVGFRLHLSQEKTI